MANPWRWWLRLLTMLTCLLIIIGPIGCLFTQEEQTKLSTTQVGPWTIILNSYSRSGANLSLNITVRNDGDVPLVFGDSEPKPLSLSADLICKDQYGKIFMELGEQEAMEKSAEAFLRGDWGALEDAGYISYKREYYPSEEERFKLRYRLHPLSEDVALYMTKYSFTRQYHLFDFPK